MNGLRLLAFSFSLAALVLARSVALAQPSDPAPQQLPVGTEYYVAFLQNEDDRAAATKFMGLMITSQVATSGWVEIPNSLPKEFSTTPGSVTTIQISRDFELKEGESFALGAIRVIARAPVTVVAVNSLFQSTGGYVVMPPDLWGTRYAPLTLPNADLGRVGQMGFIAMSDSTRLTITPSTATTKRNALEERKTTLGKGQSYLMKAREGNTGTADLSLSDVTGSRPFGLVSGHMRTPIAANKTVSTSDWASHQAVMLLPRELWSSEYISTPMRPSGDRFRLLASQDGTNLTITHYPPGGGAEQINLTLDVGDLYDSATVNGRPITGPVHWSASSPVMLVQMRTSGPYDNNPASAPAMLPLYGTDRLTSHSVFAAPEAIGADNFTQHTLTIIARGNPGMGGNDPANPLRELKLNGTPVHTLAPELLTQRIGSTDYYHVRLTIPSGGHVLTSAAGYPFTGTITGNNGTVARDSYTWMLPFWIPPSSSDVAAPYMVETTPLENGRLKAKFSDRTASYFSGLEDVAVVNSPGWRMMGTFNTPPPDNDEEASFQLTEVDPSGPLYVEVVDRAGNRAILKLHDGICRKTAYLDTNYIRIETNRGIEKTDSIVMRANPCGDTAEVAALSFSDQKMADYIMPVFGTGVVPSFKIPGKDSTTLFLTVKPNTPTGNYTTTITLTLNGSIIELTVDLVVHPPASAPMATGAENLHISVAPNPITSKGHISFGDRLGARSHVLVTDYLGRTIRTLAPEGLAGSDGITWDGLEDDGSEAPAGVYFIVVNDGARRGVTSATLVR